MNHGGGGNSNRGGKGKGGYNGARGGRSGGRGSVQNTWAAPIPAVAGDTSGAAKVVPVSAMSVVADVPKLSQE